MRRTQPDRRQCSCCGLACSGTRSDRRCSWWGRGPSTFCNLSGISCRRGIRHSSQWGKSPCTRSYQPSCVLAPCRSDSRQPSARCRRRSPRDTLHTKYRPGSSHPSKHSRNVYFIAASLGSRASIQCQTHSWSSQESNRCKSSHSSSTSPGTWQCRRRSRV